MSDFDDVVYYGRASIEVSQLARKSPGMTDEQRKAVVDVSDELWRLRDQASERWSRNREVLHSSQ